MKKINIIFSVFLGSVLAFAQTPPPPPNPESGDIGAPAPIDSYLVYLFIVAIFTIIAFINKKKNLSRI